MTAAKRRDRLTVLLLIAGLVMISCVLCNRFLGKLGVPMLLAFILLGMLFGSDGLLRIPFDDYSFAEQICSAALIFIMFYGGFGTSWKEARPVVGKAALLSTLGVVLTAALVGRSATLRWGFLCSRAFWWARSSARPTRLRCSSSCAPKSSASNTTPPRSWKWRAAATTPALTCSPPSCSRSWWAALRPGRRFISSFRRWCTAGRWAWPAGCSPCGSCGAFPSAPRGLNRSLPWRWRCFPTPCPRPWAGTATSARILRASCSATRTSSTSRRWCPFLTASPI